MATSPAAALYVTCSTGDKYHDSLAEGYRNSVVQEHLRARNLFNGFVPVLKLEKPEAFGSFSAKAQDTLVAENLKYLQLPDFTQRATKILEELNAFIDGVKKRGKELQEQTATDKPTLYGLQVERYEMLFKHHKVYVVAYQRVCELARLLDKSIERCQPPVRTLVEEKAFREQAPESHGEMLKAEETCKTYLADLVGDRKTVIDLRDKLLAKLTENSGMGYMWAIQRMSMIVDNNGSPLSVGSRLNNKLFNPAIPALPEKYPEQPKPITPGEAPTASPSGGLLSTLFRSGSRSSSPAPGSAPGSLGGSALGGSAPASATNLAALSASVPPQSAAGQEVLPGQQEGGNLSLAATTV